MYDLLCEYFSSDAVEGIFILLLAVPLIGWRIAVAMEGKAVPGFWKAHVQSLGRVGISLGICCVLFFAYSTQKDEQQLAQQQVAIELFTSISEALGSLGETLLRNYLTPEEKKSRLLPVGLATNDTAWVAESQCVTSQVREAWQRVPIRRAAFRQTLPFPVSIAGNSYNEVFISSSGVIGFDAPKGSEITREMPYEEAADHVYLALLWGRIDFKPRLGSKMWCGVKEDGNFVASYDTVFIDGDTNAVAKVQVEFIANGDMILRYSDLPPCSTNAHVAGFQNLDGGWTLPFDNIRSNSAIYLKSFGQLDLTVEDSDTDGDGISDYYELYPTNSVSLTDPCNRDSDGDGLMDGEELSLYATDPGAFSSDASGTGDLWRVTGGLTPSDATWTNATPSSSIGILTITTVLEGGTTNGGAVLRIADQYIPVLFGTTLVSRIAVPRDATNLFILARGANCDNAIAHVTVEASTFTKIRDPSGVFGWSVTLSPSCVTASGTILMPSYTITPDVVCFHCPTSKVCRITSADPDIYFVTTQGLVREYTPTAPEMQTNSFEIGSVPIQLACMDTVLSTRASVTNIPAHLCNPDSGFSDDYPHGQSYSDWCKFENGVHVWAEGYGPMNCPCLVFTNAFKCICSADGRRPCTCDHGARDPKAMPQDGSQTNVLGHAALVIGGTNDLLDVTVPEGTYRPCPLCACASGEPSSASVYRQTSCIEVTPGSLTADGAFSVAGMHPSTNFADTVFMYKEADYSGASAVTRYTRKDYTVLGTSVYPTDPGHSVSNWFIGCNVTNALTLWTGVKLPSDTGEVTLSVSVESGTPNPKLYVYNRISMTNELLVTQGQLTFTQNLGDWRDTYCDTNGYVQAHLLCSSGGVARVTHSYETYSGQPYQSSCFAYLDSTVVKVDIVMTNEYPSIPLRPFHSNTPGRKWVIATFPYPEQTNVDLDVQILGKGSAQATIMYQRGTSEESEIEWMDQPGTLFFTNGLLNASIRLNDGANQIPVMSLTSNVLTISSVQQGDRIIVVAPEFGCRDEIAVVKNFSWNDLQRIGINNLTMHADFAGLSSAIKSAIVSNVIFCLDPTIARDQRPQLTKSWFTHSGVESIVYTDFQSTHTNLLQLDIPSSRSVGMYPWDFDHWHMALEVDILPSQVVSNITDLTTAATVPWVVFSSFQSATKDKLVELLNSAYNSSNTCFILSHTYEGGEGKRPEYVDPLSSASLLPGDPIRNIRWTFSSNNSSQLTYPGQDNNASWNNGPAVSPEEVWQVEMFVNRKGEIVLIGSTDGLTVPVGMIADGLHEY